MIGGIFLHYKCEKVGSIKTLFFLPERIDPEISDLAYGYAEWGILPSIIQSTGWPWAAVPIDYAPDILRLLSLWNASIKNSKEKWVIFAAGNQLIIPHPVSWKTTGELLVKSREFGKFLKDLPPDSLTEVGFERETKKMRSFVFSTKNFKVSVSELLGPLCPK